MRAPKVLRLESWVAAVHGHPFGEASNPCISLEISRAAGRIRGIVQLTETMSTDEVQQHVEWPIRTNTPFEYSGVFTHSGASWKAKVENDLFRVEIKHGERVWTLDLQINVTEHDPGAVVQLSGNWAMYLSSMAT